MDKFDKIFELLEKKSLSNKETAYLDDAVRTDKEVGKLVTVFRSLQNNLPNSIHIDLEVLASYILYENGEEPENQTVLLLKDKIGTHLNNCKFCRVEYDNLKQEYQQAGEFINNVISKKEKTAEVQNSSFWLFRNGSTFRYAFASFVAIVMIYTGLLIYSNNNIDDYKKGLFNSGTEEVYSTRGRITLTFQKGLDAVEHGNYDEAEKYFEKDIEENRTDKSIFYTYYVLGITQLHTAENSFVGLFKNYNQKKVNEGISSFNKTIELNTSGSYENINLDAHYYLGRAYLLEDDTNNAKQNLNIVVDKKGRFYNEAKDLIDSISNSK